MREWDLGKKDSQRPREAERLEREKEREQKPLRDSAREIDRERERARENDRDGERNRNDRRRRSASPRELTFFFLLLGTTSNIIFIENDITVFSSKICKER